jgi:hypothetical protein
MCNRIPLLFVVLIMSAAPAALQAGMPAPIPSDLQQVRRLNESPQLRLQTISFFCAGFLLCAAVVQAVWNTLVRDYPSLPRLTFIKALGGVFRWGVLFVLVLTMISGARELMTPGAWKKQGFTYKLADDQPMPAESRRAARRQAGVERLRTALWQYAATHDGRFPARADLPRPAWDVPDSFGMEFGYVNGLTAQREPTLLAYEPELEIGERYVLFTNGDISTADSAKIKAWLNKGARP